MSFFAIAENANERAFFPSVKAFFFQRAFLMFFFAFEVRFLGTAII